MLVKSTKIERNKYIINYSCDVIGYWWKKRNYTAMVFFFFFLDNLEEIR